MHIENTQSELDQLKDILNNYNSFEANALLGVIFMYFIKNVFFYQSNCLQLFNEEASDYGLSYIHAGETNTNETGKPLYVFFSMYLRWFFKFNLDALCSGSELATYEPNSELIDFNELFDDSVDPQTTTPPPDAGNDSCVTTPQVLAMNAPTFPVGENKKKVDKSLQ